MLLSPFLNGWHQRCLKVLLLGKKGWDEGNELPIGLLSPFAFYLSHAPR